MKGPSSYRLTYAVLSMAAALVCVVYMLSRGGAGHLLGGEGYRVDLLGVGTIIVGLVGALIALWLGLRAERRGESFQAAKLTIYVSLIIISVGVITILLSAVIHHMTSATEGLLGEEMN